MGEDCFYVLKGKCMVPHTPYTRQDVFSCLPCLKINVWGLWEIYNYISGKPDLFLQAENAVMTMVIIGIFKV